MIRETLMLSALIAAVLLVRAVFKNRVPKRMIYCLWLVVLLKLCLPGTLFSLPVLPAEEVTGRGAGLSDASYNKKVAVIEQAVKRYWKATENSEIPDGPFFKIDAAVELMSHLGGYEITYPVVFDWEQSSEAERTASLDNTALTDCAIAFCDTIEALGYRAGCYFNQYFGYDRFDLRRLDDYCLWLAEYNSYPSFLYNVQLWQYSQSGHVPGIDTAVDLNLCLADFAG